MSHKQSVMSSSNGSDPVAQPEPEIVPKATRRSFSADYKLRIVAHCRRSRPVYGARPDRCLAAPRRLTFLTAGETWRRQWDAGGVRALAPKKRGRKTSQDVHEVEIAALRRENECLHKQLEQAELIIGAQKKLAAALEQTLTGSKDES